MHTAATSTPKSTQKKRRSVCEKKKSPQPWNNRAIWWLRIFFWVARAIWHHVLNEWERGVEMSPDENWCHFRVGEGMRAAVHVSRGHARQNKNMPPVFLIKCVSGLLSFGWLNFHHRLLYNSMFCAAKSFYYIEEFLKIEKYIDEHHKFAFLF